MIPRIIITILIIGLSFFSYSLTLPYYKNKEAAEKLMDKSYEIEDSDYNKQDAELRTNKLILMDLGSGIVIASTTILLFLILSKIKTFSDFKNTKSLNKISTFIFANLAWLLLIPGTYWYYVFRAGRGDYPPSADSIGIPIMLQIPILLLMLIPLNIFILLTTIKANLPNKLFEIPDSYDRKNILWEVFFVFWLLVNLTCFVLFVIDGDHFSIPVNLFFTFILLTLRSGQIRSLKMSAHNSSL